MALMAGPFPLLFTTAGCRRRTAKPEAALHLHPHSYRDAHSQCAEHKLPRPPDLLMHSRQHLRLKSFSSLVKVSIDVKLALTGQEALKFSFLSVNGLNGPHTALISLLSR
ncbi:hypothetical protein FKP32DRAFT_1605771 [Trametes sanguinea]|nr:hypothetical protein FKP32DRAFT_1605771 [Trametes sanguinea]